MALSTSIAAVAALAGCSDSAGSTVQSRLADTNLPSLDARGGAVEQSAQFPGSSGTNGTSGEGGTIRVTSSSGDVTIQSGASALVAPTPLIAGQGLDIVSGAILSVNGRQIVDHLRVRSGATLRITADTLFIVTGDVDISGRIVGVTAAPGVDAPDLTIRAGGIISVSGSISLRGRSNIVAESHTAIGGGVGGRVQLFAIGDLRAGPHLWVSGLIDASGGDTTELFSSAATARPGKGGSILLGTLGTLGISGKLVARGGASGLGNQLPHGDGNFADGGVIEVIAIAAIEIANAVETDASGGDSHATTAGSGGQITLEAPAGTLTVAGSDLTARGGDLRFSSSSVSGSGGSILMAADAVSLDAALVSVVGGKPVESESHVGFTTVDGEGGIGGKIQVGAFSSLVVSSTSVLRANGGRTTMPSLPGGNGGSVAIVNLDAADLSVITFDGVVEVFPGVDEFGSSGNPGNICQQGASVAAIVQITNNNEFPISTCETSGDGELEGINFVIRDLDCDGATLLPDNANATLPSGTGVDFYRIRVGASTSVTISSSGSGDIDLFAGAEVAMGSIDPADYAFSAQTANTSDEQLFVDLSNFTPGQFLTLLVVEQASVVESYSLSLSCVD